jgi:predicted DNA-binding transcriptional regulator YafY
MKKPHAPKKKDSRRGEENPSQFPRMQKVFAIMKRNQDDPNPNKTFPTKSEFARLIQGNDPKPLSDDTIGRIFDMMRDDFNLPVDFIPTRKGHGFTEPVAGFPLDVITEDQVIGLIQSVQMLGAHRQSKVYRELRKLVEKACLGITLKLGLSFADLEAALSFHVVGFDTPPPIDPDLFKAVIRAVLQKQEVRLEHRSVKRRGEVKQKTVEPLHLAIINHAPYLFHYDPELEGKKDERGEAVDPIRKFALTRIGALEPTGRRCEPRAFDIDERVRRGMGAFDDKDAVDVELRFSPKVAGLILERPWHKRQEVTEQADGGITVKLRVAHSPELEGSILRWAGDVEVVTPGALRKRMRELGQRLERAHA